MSEAHLQQQIFAGSPANDDSADEYVVIEQEEEADAEKKPSMSETNSTPSDLQSVEPSIGNSDTVADIGNGLDGEKFSPATTFPRTDMNDSNYSQNIFNSSIFGSFVMEDQLRELVRSENEQNREILDNIKITLNELATQKSHNNDLNELISLHKKSLEKALQELDIAEKMNHEKEERITTLEQRVQQLSVARDDLEVKSAQLGEELANKDEIIKVLREEVEEQHRLHGTRVKVWRERIDSLEQMLISQQERAEVNNCG